MAIDPTKRGFGFAVLEGPTRLIDWGTRDTGHADNVRALRQAQALLGHYVPDVIVMEDSHHGSSRRSDRVRILIDGIGHLALTCKISVSLVPRIEVHEVFGRAGAPNKERIAAAIIEHFEELTPRLPPHRKPWMSEDVRGSIFDAVAMALTYYYRDETESAKQSTEVR